ncbi:unnamed protein product, partial [Meganyctiphanes norvegica]
PRQRSMADFFGKSQADKQEKRVTLGNTRPPKPVATVSPQTILPAAKETTANFTLLDDEDMCDFDLQTSFTEDDKAIINQDENYKKHNKSKVEEEEVQMKRKNKRKAIVISDDEDAQLENSIEEFSPIKEPQAKKLKVPTKLAYDEDDFDFFDEGSTSPSKLKIPPDRNSRAEEKNKTVNSVQETQGQDFFGTLELEDDDCEYLAPAPLSPPLISLQTQDLNLTHNTNNLLQNQGSRT